MTNSTTLSRSNNGIDTLVIIALVCALLAAATVCVLALTLWASPLVFFSALAAACFCLDPLRSRL